MTDEIDADRPRHRRQPLILIVSGEPDRAPEIERILREAPPRVLRRLATQLTGIAHGNVLPAPGRMLVPDIRRIAGLTQLHLYPIDTVDLVLCDHHPEDGSGFDIIAYARGMRSEMVIVMTGCPSDADLAVESIRAGASDFLILPPGGMQVLPLMLEKSIAHQQLRAENQRLHGDLSRSLIELAMKNRQLESMIERLEHKARTDDLTRLANRRWLSSMLAGAWAEATRHGFPLAFAMLDLDGFKRINDSIGHQRGDEILQMLSRLLEANCREVDLCARYGGDEFCILMPHTRADEAMRVIRRVRREFAHMVSRLPQSERNLGLSAGIAQIDLSRPVNAEQLVTHADEALYAAKGAGRNLIRIRLRDGFVCESEFVASRSAPRVEEELRRPA